MLQHACKSFHMESTLLTRLSWCYQWFTKFWKNKFMWTDNTLYFGHGHQCYCNDVPIQGVPPHPPHHHNNQVFFLVSPMTCTKWVMFRMQGTTEHNQGSEKMTVFFNHFELITDCIATYNIIFKDHYWGHCCHHQHLVSLRNRTAPRKGRQKNVSNMSRLSLAHYVAIFT